MPRVKRKAEPVAFRLGFAEAGILAEMAVEAEVSVHTMAKRIVENAIAARMLETLNPPMSVEEYEEQVDGQWRNEWLVAPGTRAETLRQYDLTTLRQQSPPMTGSWETSASFGGSVDMTSSAPTSVGNHSASTETVDEAVETTPDHRAETQNGSETAQSDRGTWHLAEEWRLAVYLHQRDEVVFTNPEQLYGRRWNGQDIVSHVTLNRRWLDALYSAHVPVHVVDSL